MSGPYRVLHADPPWSFATRSAKGKGRSPERHYGCLDLAGIKALRPEVDALAAPDSVLLLWATDPILPQALEVMAAWGFAYKTVGFYWAKTNGPVATFWMEPGDVYLRRGFFTGLGFHTRANPEPCLLGTRGRGVPRLDRGVPKLIVAPRREHSRKPDEAGDRIGRLYGAEAPKVELFARTRRPGWDVALSDEPDLFSGAAP